MNKNQIIKLFLKKNIILTPDVLNILEKYDFSEINEIFLKTKENTLLTKNKIYKKNFEVLFSLTEKKKIIKKEDILSYYLLKFNKLRNIILKTFKITTSSLEHLNYGENYIVGMVRNKILRENNTSVIIEDLTTKKEIVFKNSIKHIEILKPNDVALFRVIFDKELIGKEIKFPNVPIRKPKTGFGKLCFISDLHLDKIPLIYFEKFIDILNQQNPDFLIIAGDVGDVKLLKKYADEINTKIILIPGNVDKKEYPALPINVEHKNIISLSNPCLIRINGLVILIIHEFNKEMLIKRDLGDGNNLIKPLVLEILPDIVHCGHTHQPFIENYKSISIVNSGSLLTSFKPIIIDFSTREIKQLHFKF